MVIVLKPTSNNIKSRTVFSVFLESLFVLIVFVVLFLCIICFIFILFNFLEFVFSIVAYDCTRLQLTSMFPHSCKLYA